MAEWHAASGGQVPAGAFKAGNDNNGSMYCARAQHQGDLIPGKVVPANGRAYVSHDGKEHDKDNYEVLVGNKFHWEGASSGNPLPSGNAIKAGNTASGEVLYIGKVRHDGVDVVGKVHPSHKKCYIPYGGEEHSYEEFQILVVD